MAGDASSTSPLDPHAGTTPSGRALTRRGAGTQQRLVDAAWKVFGTKPYNEARITEITARAGVSTGSFYTYFASKEELFRVIARAVLDEMTAAPTRAPDNPDRNPVRDIAYASRRFFLICFRHRVVARSIEQLHDHDDDVHLARRSALVTNAKRVERWIRRLQAQGTCDPDIDPWFTAVALQAMNVTLAYEQLVHGEDIAKIDSLVGAVTPIWARAVGLDARLAEMQTWPPTDGGNGPSDPLAVQP